MMPQTSLPTSPKGSPQLELSVVMPCLNEAETLAICVDEALLALAKTASTARSSLRITAPQMARRPSRQSTALA